MKLCVCVATARERNRDAELCEIVCLSYWCAIQLLPCQFRILSWPSFANALWLYNLLSNQLSNFQESD
jgi:hypothetical protein